MGHYELHAEVIMANHVHRHVSPLVNQSRYMQSLKGFTARQANQELGRTGQPFWQAESYDHWVRNRREWQRIRHYIENNPVRAGLAARAGDYRWSSAHRFRGKPDQAVAGKLTAGQIDNSWQRRPAGVYDRSGGSLCLRRLR